MAQYKNVLSWLETEYLAPALQITKKAVIDSSQADTGNYPELEEIEELLVKALEYVKRHQK